MKVSSKIKVMVLVVIVAMLGLYSTSFAEPIDDIKNAIAEQLNQYKTLLEADKVHYGFTLTDVVDNINLGEGYLYYKISTSYLKDTQKSNVKPSLEKLLIPTDAYIFQLNVSNKPTATLFVEKSSGKWTIVEMSSYASLEKDINGAKEKIKQNEKKTGSENKLIYDVYTGLVGLSTTDVNNEYIMPMKDIKSLAIDKHEIKNLSEISDKVVKLLKDRDSSQVITGGVGSPSGDSSNRTQSNNYLNIALLVIGTFIVLSISYVIIRRRNVKQN